MPYQISSASNDLDALSAFHPARLRGFDFGEPRQLLRLTGCDLLIGSDGISNFQSAQRQLFDTAALALQALLLRFLLPENRVSYRPGWQQRAALLRACPLRPSSPRQWQRRVF